MANQHQQQTVNVPPPACVAQLNTPNGFEDLFNTKTNVNQGGRTSDTGFRLANEGVEVKVFGVGGRVDALGMQLCPGIGPCVGTNWPWKG